MKKKILVLDDDADILELLFFILTEFGYEVKALLSGDNIFDDIKEFQPDLILMDVMLGRLDGRSICKSIKENQLTQSVPVILISGTHNLTNSLHFPGAPNDFIIKPIEVDSLIEKIKNQLSI